VRLRHCFGKSRSDGHTLRGAGCFAHRSAENAAIESNRAAHVGNREKVRYDEAVLGWKIVRRYRSAHYFRLTDRSNKQRDNPCLFRCRRTAERSRWLGTISGSVRAYVRVHRRTTASHHERPRCPSRWRHRLWPKSAPRPSRHFHPNATLVAATLRIVLAGWTTQRIASEGSSRRDGGPEAAPGGCTGKV
jgi:hypothetical protein